MKIRTYNKNKAWLWLIFISFIVIFIWGINSERTQQDNFQSRKALVLNEVYTNREQGISDKKWLCDWIEIYNGTEQNILLKDYGLSDEKEVPGKWRFPDAVIESGEYLVVALDELGVSDAYSLVADFTLNKNGDYIYLSDEKDYIIDEVKIPELDENQSFGRYPDGAEQFQKFVSISPGEVNRKNHLQNDFWVDYNEKVEFSIEGGYFDEEIEVALSVKNPDAEIYYTLDGSEPDENSLHYTKTIKVGSRAEEPNKYTNIEADTDGTTCLSTSPVYKGTVIRARAYLDGRQSDNITTNTYFYCPDYTVPIVSLVTNPDNLFGYKEGIYVPGIDYYYGIRSRNGEINIGNYYRKGKIGKKGYILKYLK